MDIILLATIVWLIFSQFRLKKRMSILEGKLGVLSSVPPVVQTVVELEAQPPQITFGPWSDTSATLDAQTDEPEVAEQISAPIPRAAREPDHLARLWVWLQGNWALAVSGVSLALAGIFLVQYGVEKGLLTPGARVIAALILGALLIGSGEFLRRRHGDEGAGAGAVAGLPSILSGAGLTALFGATLAAHTLYGLTGPGVTLAGLTSIAGLAIVLGWFHGPVLTGFGLLAASAAPFLVDGSSDAAWIFHYYYALIAIVGLTVDAARQWRWISALSLITGSTGATLVHLGIGNVPHYLGFWAILVLAALLAPGLRHRWQDVGQSMTQWSLISRKMPLPSASIPFFAVAAASLAAVSTGVDADGTAIFWLSAGFLVLMMAGLSVATHADALEDLPVLPGLALLAIVALEAIESGPLYRDFMAPLQDVVSSEEKTSVTMTILMALGAVISLAFADRMRRADEVTGILWAIAAATAGPAMALILEWFWAPALISAYPWALHVMAMAALMTVIAVRVSADADRLRTALFAGSALVLITMALFAVLSEDALTLSIAVMVLAVVLIDRHFNLPLLGALVHLGVVVIGYRILLDPGVLHAVTDADWIDILIGHVGVLIVLYAARAKLPGSTDRPASVVIESALWSVGAILASVVLYRSLGQDFVIGHAGLGLMAAVWLTSMMVQLYRIKFGGRFARNLRLSLSIISGLVALLWMAAQAFVANPLLPILRSEPVVGPPVFGSLMVAFLPIAMIFAFGAWKNGHLPKAVRAGFATLASLYAAVWAALEIRRAWQGRDLSLPGVIDGELYSYTLAMVLAAAGLLVLALLRRSELLRKIAMAGVAVTVAKVFLIDMSGLTGLLRVASFLGLGLSLAGLGWLNARISVGMRSEPSSE